MIEVALEQARAEVERAMTLYPPMRSPEEAMFVIREEYLEAEQEIFKKPAKRSLAHWDAELTQIAAMALRAKAELTLPHLTAGEAPHA